MSDILHVTLPIWARDSLHIRYIYLVNNSTFRLTKCPNKGLAIPLFLGADLLSNTGIRTENQPRYHAKFAKKGLATKLHFPSVYRFHGLRLPSSNNSLWFYSVQGLFRIAFELYNKHDQLSVLEDFQEIWKCQINNEPLQMGYNLSEQLDISAESSDEVSEMSECITEEQTLKNPRDTSTDHDYCSLTQENPEDASSDSISSLHQQIQKLKDKLPQIQPQQLRTVGTFLDLIDGFIEGDLNETAVTEGVMALLQAQQWEGLYSSCLLNNVGRWLGKQFHEANSSISQKVEGFKVRHINRISDLPPAEELTKELFPEAMLGLLLHWMGLSEDSSVDKRRSEYPILLLILEFANHNLITGVAHVLYSSLICK